MHGIVRSITHWTAGGGRASALDKKHYHRITEFDGTIVQGNETIADNIVTSDGDYAAHTLHLNTGSAGFAMAGMRGAVEEPFSAGPSPLNENQFEAHCRMLAEFHISYGIPITGKTCLTHAEVEPVLGVKQRGKWDIARLPFKPELRGAIAVGDYMRERVRAYAGVMEPPKADRPVLRKGSKGAFVLDLQDLLTRAGFFSGKLDGDFGSRTETAVLGFQSFAGLETDGVVGDATWTALQKPIELPTRDVSAKDLRERGSTTIKAADKGQTIAAGAGSLSVAGIGVESLTGASQKLREADGALAAAQGLIQAYWPLLLALAAAGAIWYYFHKVKGARVEDARTGRNLGR